MKFVQHATAKIILDTRLFKFVGKQSLGVSDIGHAFRLRHKGCGGREGDVSLRTGCAGAEADGGNVSLARGTQTQDETQRSWRQSTLIGMWHDGWIEQRRRLHRILVREVSTDEH